MTNPKLSSLTCLLILCTAGCQTPSIVKEEQVPPEVVFATVGPVFECYQLDQKPAATVHKAPQYPYELRRHGISGYAICELIISAEGKVAFAKVIKCNNQELGVAAKEAVLQWQFSPGVKNATPVACRMEQRLEFTAPK